jgi:hypothetical protein
MLQHSRTTFALLASLVANITPALSQTESQCLQSFNVKTDKNVTYIATDQAGQHKVSVNTMSCVDAERFRTTLYVAMDKQIYDSEQVLKNQLAAAQSALDKLTNDLNSTNNQANMKAILLGAGTTFATLKAISTTAACASTVVDGVGIAACGPAAASAIAAIAAWEGFKSHTGTAASLKSAALAEIQKRQSEITALSPQLNAAKAKNMKDNYSQLFVAICRAVHDQCL